MHIKYRPKNFDQVVGNTAIIEALKKRTDNRPVLFQGERGCGKTTLAYIIGNNFGAPKENIIIYDCMNNSEIAKMRDLLESLYGTTLFGKKRVVILEEIHGLSDKAKEALLAPLDGESRERLPDYVQIVACTTEPQKIKGTLYDRFKKYRVLPLSDSEALYLINYVAKQEELTVPKWAKALLLQKSEGNPRRLLVGLDTIKDCEIEEHAEHLLEIVKIEEDKDVLTLFGTIIKGSYWTTLKEVLNSILKKKSPNDIRIGLMNLIGARLTSQYFKEEKDAVNLSTMFDILNEAQGIPEKAKLINAIYKLRKD